MLGTLKYLLKGQDDNWTLEIEIEPKVENREAKYFKIEWPMTEKQKK